MKSNTRVQVWIDQIRASNALIRAKRFSRYVSETKNFSVRFMILVIVGEMIGYGIRFKRWCKLRRCFPISQRDFRVDLIEEWWNKNIAFVEGYYCGSILVSWQDVLRGWECEVWKVKSFLTFYDLCITSRHLQAFYHGTTWSVIQVTVIFPEIATRHTFARA